jgi:hypothetical protein
MPNRALWTIGSIVALLTAVSLLPPTAHAAARAKSRYLVYAPDAYTRVETIVTKQKEKKYYVFTPSKPIEFAVTGPTELRLATRLLYAVDMKGEQHYTVTITEHGLLGRTRDVATYTLTTRKSPVSTVAGKSRLVPATGRVVKLPVSAGSHRYQIHLSGTAAEAGLRILIPKNDVRP